MMARGWGADNESEGWAVRVSIIGQAAFGEAVLTRLREDGVDIAGVSAAAPKDGGKPDPLWAKGVEMGLPTVDTKALKEPAGQAVWHGLGADLCVMAFVTDILPDIVFDDAKMGTIQYHPSLLPLHRGSSAIAWAIINGRTETGVTIFWPDKGIDTGPILLQERCPVNPEDTVTSLYFQKLFPMGVEALSKAVRMVADGTAPSVEQDHALATYEPPLRDEHCAIAWHLPAETLDRLIRGANPAPGAWTTYEGKKLRIFDISWASDGLKPGMPGRVLEVGDAGILVRLNGGRVLRIGRVQYEGGKKEPAIEWAKSVGLEPGYRFR